MTENGRFIPPRSGRLAWAARKGFFPHSRSLVAGMACLAGAAAAYAGQGAIEGGFQTLFSGGLHSAVQRDLGPVEASLHAGRAVIPMVLAGVIAPFLGALLGAWIPVVLFRRGKGQTAVPLPRMPSSRIEIAAIRFLGSMVFVLAVLHIVRAVPSVGNAPDGGIRVLGHLIMEIVFLLGGILTVVGAAEVLCLRVSLFRALFLNRQEARREARATDGNRALIGKRRREKREEPVS